MLGRKYPSKAQIKVLKPKGRKVLKSYCEAQIKLTNWTDQPNSFEKVSIVNFVAGRSASGN